IVAYIIDDGLRAAVRIGEDNAPWDVCLFREHRRNPYSSTSVRAVREPKGTAGRGHLFRQTVTTRLHSRDESCSPFLAGCSQRRNFCRSECGRSALRIARIGTMNASTGADEAREYHDPPEKSVIDPTPACCEGMIMDTKPRLISARGCAYLRDLGRRARAYRSCVYQGACGPKQAAARDSSLSAWPAT